MPVKTLKPTLTPSSRVERDDFNRRIIFLASISVARQAGVAMHNRIEGRAIEAVGPFVDYPHFAKGVGVGNQRKFVNRDDVHLRRLRYVVGDLPVQELPKSRTPATFPRPLARCDQKSDKI